MKNVIMAWMVLPAYFELIDGDLKSYQNPREASSRKRIFLLSLVYVCMYLFMCVRPLGQTKNFKDLEFGTHSPQDHI